MGCSRRQGSATLLHDRVGALRLGLALVASLMLALVVGRAGKGRDSLACQSRTAASRSIRREPRVRRTPSRSPRARRSFTVSDTTAPVTAAAGCTAVAEPTRRVPTRARRARSRRSRLTCATSTTWSTSTLSPSARSCSAGQGPTTSPEATASTSSTGAGDADTINARGLGQDTVLCDAADTVISDPDDAVPAACANNDVAPARRPSRAVRTARPRTSPTSRSRSRPTQT